MTITQIKTLKEWFCSKSDKELVQFLTHNLVKNRNDVFMRSIPDSLVADWIETVQNLATMNIIVGQNYSKKMISSLVIAHNELCKKEYNRIRIEFCGYLDSFL